MASRTETVEYICDQIVGCGEVRYRKMFGEFMVYLNDKPIFMICDDILYVKINETSAKFLGNNNNQGFPYDGAKLHYIVDDIDNRELMKELASGLEKITPIPKSKKKKT